ncbi:DUF2278 family protein [Bacillus toyonensis]|uniref:DUF2278 family protein n=1 Tax=Bacillus toyonensis TaxID=155322 RepID=UPI000BF21766|nr:DUF2278 family protein [Bacillus toyonensis]MCU5397023.1 YukJ family protein [Bacillus toyonensis]PEM64248.1 hypothetical protein CN625_01790 [Bacillus toyonensis]PEN71879.1 hypothetical protein CN539_21515 [Bacillus toyonensis]QWH48626.1 DUF2278 family protein [Bacillus toyonensis]
MPLQNGYGVIIGSVNKHYIEPPDEEGRWPHYLIFVNNSAGIYECAVNLKSRTNIKIEYKHIENLDNNMFEKIIILQDGFYRLASDADSGAIDVIRHKGVLGPHLWVPENGNNVIELMKTCLKGVKRVYIFGEPFDVGLGVHNVHMNQGDPLDSDFSKENGIWQDGAVMFEYDSAPSSYAILLTKFQTQCLQTDNAGHPIVSARKNE